MILYGKTRQRLSMKIDLYDTFRILEDRGHFWLPMVSWGTPYFGTRFWLKFWLISSKKIHPKGGVLAGGPPKNGHSWGPINFYMVIWSLPNFGIRFWLNFWLISSKKNHPKGGVLAGGPPKNCHSWGPINKAPKKWDPYAGIGTQEAKSNRFLDILVSQLR